MNARVIAAAIGLAGLVALAVGCGNDSVTTATDPTPTPTHVDPPTPTPSPSPTATPTPSPTATPQSGWCVPDGGFDDTLYLTSCCSGVAVSGTTVCANAADYGTTWASCNHVCGTVLVQGCVPSGGTDDTLGNTSCCSGQAIPGSTHCLDPRDYGTTWTSCVQTCM